MFKRLFVRDVPVFNETSGNEGVWAMEILLHAYVTLTLGKSSDQVNASTALPQGKYLVTSIS